MKADLGSFVTGLSGKLGSHVAARNKGGAYFRKRVKPSNPRTSFQTTVRANFTTGSKEWSSLTDAQRKLWNGATSLMSKFNAFGNKISLSGKSFYQAISNNLLLVGETAIASPIAPSDVYMLVPSAVVADNSSQSLTFTFPVAIPATHKVVICATPSVSAGTSNAKNRLRQIGVYDNTDVSPLAVSADYIARLGAVGAAGQKIFYKIYAIEIASGFPNAVVEGNTVIVA